MARAIKNNWIIAYSDEIGKISEAPSDYNVWAAISVIGSILKNNVYFKRSTYTVYPNNYIILTGPPGVGKGSSIHPAYNLAKNPPLCNIIADRITVPRILEKLAKGNPTPIIIKGIPTVQPDNSCVLMSLELPVLITGSDWMLPFLCEAWDRGEYSYDTKNAGTSTPQELCTSLIGACVPDYIRKLNKDSNAAISGGFTARAIFVYADRISKKIVWPKPLDSTPQGVKLIQDFKDDLLQMSQLKGEFKFSQQGSFAFEKFYNALVPREGDSDVIQHFKSRLPVHVIKVAMIFAVAEGDSLVIEYRHVISAIDCLKRVLANLDKAFRGVGDSDMAEATARVQNFIEQRKTVTRNEILASLHKNISPETLDRILPLLCQIGFCALKTVNNITFYVYRKEFDKTDKTISSKSGEI